MRKSIIFTILIVSAISASSQQRYKAAGMKGALIFQDEMFGEIGVANYTVLSSKVWLHKAWGPNIGFEYNFNFKNGKFILAPKIGYEYFFYATLLQAGIHLIDYTNFKGVHDLRISPQVGISFLVLLNISYDYQFNISRKELPTVADHKLSLKLNFIGLFNNEYKKFNRSKMKFHR